MASYITAEGYRKLKEEAEWLWRVERPRVTREVAEAAAQGDRSENAEYIYGKRRLREIDRRLRWLTKRMDELTVVRPSPEQRGRAYFGAIVRVGDEAGEERSFQLVGPDESDPAAGRLSIESPLGRALVGRREGDEVRVPRPQAAAVTWEILEIRYGFEEEEEGSSA